MTDEDEDPSIAARDWRLAAITSLAQPFRSPSGIVHPIGTPMVEAGFLYFKGDVLSHMVPHPSALFLAASVNNREQARSILAAGLTAFLEPMTSGEMRIRVDRETAFFDCLQALAGSVVFAHAAVEALSNQLIPDDFVYKTTAKDGAAIDRTKEQIERWESLDTKLDKILPVALKLSSPRGTGVWQRYEAVKSWRDRVTHIKTADVRGSRRETAKETLWTALLDKKVLEAPEYAAAVMSYYFPKDAPRWLQRFCSGAPAALPARP